MPTVKTQGGKVVTKGGKVSCECCEPTCQYSARTTAIEITPAQYALIYAGGTLTIPSFVATYDLAVTLGCTRQILQATSTFEETSIPLTANRCFINGTAGIGISVHSGQITAEVVTNPCSRVVASSSTSGNNASLNFQLTVWNIGSPFAFDYGMSATVNLEATAGGQITFTDGISISVAGTAARRTASRTPPETAAGGYGASSVFGFETTAGNLNIPTFEQPVRAVSGTAQTPTNWAGTNSFGATKFVLSASAP